MKMKKSFRNDQERSEFLSELAGLLGDGYPLSEALDMLGSYYGGVKKNWIDSIYEALQDGDDFSSVLHEASFPNDVISYIGIYEKYGDLKTGLDNGASILKKKFELKQKSRKLLNYPIMLFGCLIIMIVVLSQGVLPQMEMFFQSMNKELPLLTKMIIGLLSLLEGPILLVLLIVMIFFLLWLQRLKPYERLKYLLRLPLIKKLTTNLMTFHFASHLSPLLSNGFSLYQSLLLLEEHSKIDVIQMEAKAIGICMLEGISLPEIIRERNCYEPQLVTAIALGQAKGALGQELERYSDFLQRKYYEGLERYLSLLQPLLFSIIGVVVLTLFLSVMLPIFNIVEGW
ncbi:MAG: type II secretion system F family protein [Bacillus sp. (in: Bacteria)]|nr:type II secretion system F family protein [Bacillus sp. (in: firmicutes)]